MIDRGIYLVIYTGEGQEDKPKDLGFLRIEKSCCKFGKSLELSKVQERYNRHCNNQADVWIAGRFKDRDDIDLIEKKLHRHFRDMRLINRNNRPSEWMQPVNIEELRRVFHEVVRNHFSLF